MKNRLVKVTIFAGLDPANISEGAEEKAIILSPKNIVVNGLVDRGFEFIDALRIASSICDDLAGYANNHGRYISSKNGFLEFKPSATPNR